MVIILPDIKNVLRFWNDSLSRSDISEPKLIISWRPFLPKCKSKVSRIRFKVVRSAADMHTHNWSIFYRKFPCSIVGIIICRSSAVISTFRTIIFTNGRFWTPTYHWKVRLKSKLEKQFISRYLNYFCFKSKSRIRKHRNRDSESVVFNSGQKMALRAVYVVIC